MQPYPDYIDQYPCTKLLNRAIEELALIGLQENLVSRGEEQHRWWIDSVNHGDGQDVGEFAIGRQESCTIDGDHAFGIKNKKFTSASCMIDGDHAFENNNNNNNLPMLCFSFFYFLNFYLIFYLSIFFPFSSLLFFIFFLYSFFFWFSNLPFFLF